MKRGNLLPCGALEGAEEGSIDLTDEQWAILEPPIPKPRVRSDGRGRPWCDDRVSSSARRRLLSFGLSPGFLVEPERYGAFSLLHTSLA